VGYSWCVASFAKSAKHSACSAPSTSLQPASSGFERTPFLKAVHPTREGNDGASRRFHLEGGRSALPDNAISAVRFKLVEPTGLKPGLEMALRLCIPRGTRNMPGAGMRVRYVAPIGPARQGEPGREEGGMLLGRRHAATCGWVRRRWAAALLVFDLHCYLISLGKGS
jgi:hypothetical protein